MLWLCVGHRPVRIPMQSTCRYMPEQLVSSVQRCTQWNTVPSLELNGRFFQLHTQNELELAAAIVAYYHNDYVSTAPETDFWNEETEQMEENTLALEEETESI